MLRPMTPVPMNAMSGFLGIVSVSVPSCPTSP